MKVKLEKDYKDWYTVSDLERAKEVIKVEKWDDETAAGWAQYAVNEALKSPSINDSCEEILKASARTAKNNRVWNAYGENTGNMDVWIEAIAQTIWGFLKVGAYLSDIWESGATDYRDKMYVKYYTEN